MRIVAFTVIALLVAAAFAGSANQQRGCPSLQVARDIAETADDPPSLQETEANATIHGVVEESGVLRDVHVMKASSPEAGDWLKRKVSRMEFKPRPKGCGPVAYEVKLNVAHK